MIEELLGKTRTMNKTLQKSGHPSVNCQEMAEVLSDNVDCSVYIIDNRGKVLGYNCPGGLTCEVVQEIIELPEGFPRDYCESIFHLNETHSNVCQKGNACVFAFNRSCKFNNKVITIVPVVGAGMRLGTVVMVRCGRRFTAGDLILAEYGATMVGMKVLRSQAARLEAIARKRTSMRVAVAALSYGELTAIRHVFRELTGDEGVVVSGRIAKRVGMTPSVFINALRKFESAGVIKCKSLGVRGTYIKVLNDRLLEQLEPMNRNFYRPPGTEV